MLEVTKIDFYPVRSSTPQRVKCMLAITFCDAIKVTGCRLVDGKNGLFLSYPAEKKGTDTFFQIVTPRSREIADWLNKTVLEEWARFNG